MLEAKSDTQLLEEAQRFYDEQLKHVLEPEHNGEYVVIDVDNQAYAFDRRIEDAHEKLRARGSSGYLACLRIGEPFVVDFYGPR